MDNTDKGTVASNIVAIFRIEFRPWVHKNIGALSMVKSLLLTSFATWLSHHRTNSSDDLLGHLAQRNCLPQPYFVLRQLPVDFFLAPQLVLTEIEAKKPDVILCCGMAEKRDKLALESRGTNGDLFLETTANLEAIAADLPHTEISHDAGTFVCNSLYYRLLEELRDRNSKAQCLFVHVPLIDETNLEAILADFNTIIRRFLAAQTTEFVIPSYDRFLKPEPRPKQRLASLDIKTNTRQLLRESR